MVDSWLSRWVFKTFSPKASKPASSKRNESHNVTKKASKPASDRRNESHNVTKKKSSGSKSSGSSGSSSGSGGTSSGGVSGGVGTGGVGTGTAPAVEEVIENKYNDISGYFDAEEEEFIASTDTPTVRIYISRERVPEKDEETGETKEETSTEETKETIVKGTTGGTSEQVESVEEAVRESVKIAELYRKNKDITNQNTAIIKTGDQKIVAMKAISDIDFNEIDFGEDANTEEILKKIGLL